MYCIGGCGLQQIQQPISEFLSSKATPTITVDASAMDAVDKMTTERSECLLVVDDDKVVGIFTERDFLNRVVGARLIPAETPLRNVMTTNPDTLQSDNSIAYAIERMANRGFRNIPIVDDGDPPAVLTVWDVMSHLSTVLAEVEDEDDYELDEWTDIGGGG
jgi:CBS domain-containing protein